MIEHDKNCGGCERQKPRRRGVPVWANIGICARHGSTHESGSYLHQVGGKDYCAECANIAARANNEVVIGIGW
jgi:hypothetical protein